MADTANSKFFDEIVDAIVAEIGDENFMVDQPLQVRLSPVKTEEEGQDKVAEIIEAIIQG